MLRRRRAASHTDVLPAIGCVSVRIDRASSRPAGGRGRSARSQGRAAARGAAARAARDGVRPRGLGSLPPLRHWGPRKGPLRASGSFWTGREHTCDDARAAFPARDARRAAQTPRADAPARERPDGAPAPSRAPASRARTYPRVDPSSNGISAFMALAAWAASAAKRAPGGATDLPAARGGAARSSWAARSRRALRAARRERDDDRVTQPTPQPWLAQTRPCAPLPGPHSRSRRCKTK